jgi:hypothetical protein
VVGGVGGVVGGVGTVVVVGAGGAVGAVGAGTPGTVVGGAGSNDRCGGAETPRPLIVMVLPLGQRLSSGFAKSSTGSPASASVMKLCQISAG